MFALRRKRPAPALDPFAGERRPIDAPALVVPAPTPPVSATGATSDAVEDPDAGMPRWRRPSLVAARRSAPGSAAAMASERVTFDRGVVRPEDGREIRRIRYRMVRVADRPDQLLSVELGWLDEDDEVELVQPWGAFWRIRTPLGLEGWVHRTTLGDPVVRGRDGTGAASLAFDPELAERGGQFDHQPISRP